MHQNLLENLFSTKNLVAALGEAGMVALGELMMLKNTLVPGSAPGREFHWWAMFIALCAFGAAINGGGLWIKTGAFSLSVVGLWWTAMMLLMGAIFEWLRLEWWLWGYWLVIATGLGLVLSAFLPEQKRRPGGKTDGATDRGI